MLGLIRARVRFKIAVQSVGFFLFFIFLQFGVRFLVSDFRV